MRDAPPVQLANYVKYIGIRAGVEKTACEHLLKNLDGCIAWRNPAQAEKQKELEQARQYQAADIPEQENNLQEEAKTKANVDRLLGESIFPLFLLAASITVVLLLVAFVIIVANREKIEKKYYFSLAFFTFPPFVCIVLQIAFYGISLMLNSVVLSLFMVLLNIQNQNMDTDFLTGVNNRKKLEIYLNEKVSTSTTEKTFSAIMIDIDDFKAINDIYGHDMGDNALQTLAKLLSSCISTDDFIARYGGDEFCIVLDASNSDELEEVVSRINDCIENYNKSSVQPYKLSFSMGYAMYNYQSHMKVEEFQKQIDALMYEKKQAKKYTKIAF